MADPITLLLAIDDDDVSYRAAGAATNWFPDDSRVVAIHVAHPLSANVGAPPAHPDPMAMGAIGTIGGYPYVPPSAFREDQAEAIERGRQIAHRGAEIAGGTARVETGDTARTITDVARRIGADVIVVGTGDRSWLSRLFEPSVSTEVVHKAPCSVLVVRADGV